MGVSQIYGYPFGGPHNKGYSISGSILGYPYFEKLPYKIYFDVGVGMIGHHDSVP